MAWIPSGGAVADGDKEETFWPELQLATVAIIGDIATAGIPAPVMVTAIDATWAANTTSTIQAPSIFAAGIRCGGKLISTVA